MQTTLASVACLNLMSTLVEDTCIMTRSGHMNAATASSAAAAADPMPATLLCPETRTRFSIQGRRTHEVTYTREVKEELGYTREAKEKQGHTRMHKGGKEGARIHKVAQGR